MTTHTWHWLILLGWVEQVIVLVYLLVALTAIDRLERRS